MTRKEKVNLLENIAAGRKSIESLNQLDEQGEYYLYEVQPNVWADMQTGKTTTTAELQAEIKEKKWNGEMLLGVHLEMSLNDRPHL